MTAGRQAGGQFASKKSSSARDLGDQAGLDLVGRPAHISKQRPPAATRQRIGAR
jgi:hypothetical protein